MGGSGRHRSNARIRGLEIPRFITLGLTPQALCERLLRRLPVQGRRDAEFAKTNFQSLLAKPREIDIPSRKK
jgi:hypothetical protein